MIRAILFDFGQTLVDSANGFRAAEKEAQTKVFSNLSLTLWDEFLSNYRRIRKEFHAKSIFSRKTIWKEVYFYYCLEPDLKRLEIWENEYWERVKAETVLFPETVQVLEKLNTEYRLGLITNTQGQKTSGKHRISLFPELERFFEVVIVAGEADVPPKPDPAPFHLCLDSLNTTPGEAVYIGDDWRIDICGAKDIGLQAIWIKHHSVRRSWPDIKTSVSVITSLDQLLHLDRVLD